MTTSYHYKVYIQTYLNAIYNYCNCFTLINSCFMQFSSSMFLLQTLFFPIIIYSLNLNLFTCCSLFSHNFYVILHFNLNLHIEHVTYIYVILIIDCISIQFTFKSLLHYKSLSFFVL